jgi:tRNA(Ile)-lysidine synthase
VARVDVRARAREEGRSIEAAARTARYAVFDAAAQTLGATAVATGHTLDDQAETVLLRLLRGAGSRGVSAIRARRGPYVRPLIDCRRADLIEYLEARGEPFRVDASNTDLTVPRNRLRHGVLKAIAADWPGSVPALARFAELAADDEEFLVKTASEVMSAVALPAVGGVQVLDVRGLNPLPAALARRIVRAAIEAAGGAPAFRDVEAVRRLARADKLHGHLDLGGLAVERSGPALRFLGPGSKRPAAESFEYPLAVPGRANIVETGVVIQASLTKGPSEQLARADGRVRAALQADTLRAPLVVRNRRPGDRLRPFGAPGSRKLQDLLVDRKVPREERDRLPLVVDQTGRILWVVGLTIAEEYRVTAPESGMVILEIEKGTL